MVLLKYGRQMVTGLSRSQQHLRFGRLLTTRSTHHSSSEFVKSPDDDDCHDELKYGRRIIGLPFYEYPRVGFFTRLFNKDSTPPLPAPGTAADLLGKIMDVAEIIKSSPEEKTDVDQICPLLKEMLGRVTHETTVKLLYELARPAASPSSPPPAVIDSKVKEFIDNLPTKIVPLFEDMTIDMLEDRYWRLLDKDISCSSRPQTVTINADVSPLRNQSIKVFVAGDLLVVSGSDKDWDFPNFLTQCPQQMVKLPRFPYFHHDVTAYITQGKLDVDFPRLADSEVVNVPRVYQVDLDYDAPYETPHKKLDSFVEWMESLIEGVKVEETEKKSA